MIMALLVAFTITSSFAQTEMNSVPDVQTISMKDDLSVLKSEFFLFKLELNSFVKDYKIENQAQFVLKLSDQSEKRSVVVVNRFISFSEKSKAFIEKYDSKAYPMCYVYCGAQSAVCESNCNQHPMGSNAYIWCMGPCVYQYSMCQGLCYEFPNEY